MLELHALLGPGSEETYSLPELDGFFHGILSLPRLVMPSEWLEDVLPDATSEKAMRHAVDLILRQYNTVAHALKEGEVEPYFDGSGQQAKHWLEGFGRAFSYNLEAIQRLADAEVNFTLLTDCAQSPDTARFHRPRRSRVQKYQRANVRRVVQFVLALRVNPMAQRLAKHSYTSLRLVHL